MKKIRRCFLYHKVTKLKANHNDTPKLTNNY